MIIHYVANLLYIALKCILPLRYSAHQSYRAANMSFTGDVKSTSMVKRSV